MCFTWGWRASTRQGQCQIGALGEMQGVDPVCQPAHPAHRSASCLGSTAPGLRLWRCHCPPPGVCWERLQQWWWEEVRAGLGGWGSGNRRMGRGSGSGVFSKSAQQVCVAGAKVVGWRWAWVVGKAGQGQGESRGVLCSLSGLYYRMNY
jgi:hypothetical protein